MTEDQATMKWCPFARLLAHTYSQDGKGRSFEGGYSYNRSPDPDEQRAPYLPDGASCIGSACMAWRPTKSRSLAVAKVYAEDGAKINAIKALREVFADLNLLDAKNIVEGKQPWPEEPGAEGFCGLAGAPQ